MNLVRAWTTLASLTFRRLLLSVSTMMVLLPLAGCLLFVLRRGFDRGYSVREFRDFSEFMILIFASFVVPICALAFGTASVGGDREDRTDPRLRSVHRSPPMTRLNRALTIQVLCISRHELF